MFTYVFIGGILAISVFSAEWCSRSHKRYSKVSSLKGFSGREAAEMILKSEGVTGVSVLDLPPEYAHVGDHYDSVKKCIRLSDSALNGNSIDAVATAAHEAGHAIQDQRNYFFAKMRLSVSPYKIILLEGLAPLLFVGFFISSASGWNAFSNIMAFAYFALASASLVEIPSEFDASRRGKKKLLELGIIDESELKGVSYVLNAAVFTYVTLLGIAVLQMFFFTFRLMGRIYLLIHLFLRKAF